MTTKIDMGKIVRGLGAERRGKVSAGGGYFSAVQLRADIEARLRAPGDGDPTNPGPSASGGTPGSSRARASAAGRR